MQRFCTLTLLIALSGCAETLTTGLPGQRQTSATSVSETVLVAPDGYVCDDQSVPGLNEYAEALCIPPAEGFRPVMWQNGSPELVVIWELSDAKLGCRASLRWINLEKGETRAQWVKVGYSDLPKGSLDYVKKTKACLP